MTKVRDLLKDRVCPGFPSIDPEAPVLEAIKAFCEKDIEAMVVLDNGLPVGFVNERDLLTQALQGHLRNLAKKRIKEVMSREIIIAALDDDLAYLCNVMAKNKIPHLPIIHQSRVVGMVSIAEIMQAQISDEKFENKMLHNYIEGNYPG